MPVKTGGALDEPEPPPHALSSIEMLTTQQSANLLALLTEEKYLFIRFLIKLLSALCLFLLKTDSNKNLVKLQTATKHSSNCSKLACCRTNGGHD
jgi:hypothetical protein